MSSNDTTAVNNNSSANQLAELKAKYEASKKDLENAKTLKSQHASIYNEYKAKYATTDPTKVQHAKDELDKYTNQYTDIDNYNTFLNGQYFSDILKFGSR